jgi:hypothetical protein
MEAPLMSNALSKPILSDFALAATQGQIERHGGVPEVEAIYKEAMQHLVAERVQAFKTTVAVNLTTSVYQHTLQTGDQFSQTSHALLENNRRSPAAQVYTEQIGQVLLSMYPEHLRAILHVGVTNIAQEATKSVTVPPVKKGWFW